MESHSTGNFQIVTITHVNLTDSILNDRFCSSFKTLAIKIMEGVPGHRTIRRGGGGGREGIIIKYSKARVTHLIRG